MSVDADTLTHASADISIALATEIARDCYAIEAHARKLVGERDSNFHLLARDGRQYMLKVVNTAEDPAVTSFQTSALLHLARSDPPFCTQRIVPATDGSVVLRLNFPGEGLRSVRVVTFVEGTMQSDCAPSQMQLRNIGSTLARLHVALADFEPPAASYALVWDIKRASALRRFLPAVIEPQRRAVLAAHLDRVDTVVAPALASMRSLVVHNDLNADNIIVDPSDHSQVIALIDFGDMIKTAAICDVAIAAAYQLSEGVDLLDPACNLIAGFNTGIQLDPSEIDILFDLILTRMVARLLITEWRATRFPENRKYILRNTSRTWRQFEQLSRLSASETTATFRRVCGRAT